MKGLFAAVATPIHDDGRFDEAGFDRLVEFLVEAGVDGICISGATGEFPHFEMAERLAVIKRAAERLPRDRVLLVGIGSSSMRRTLALGEAAVAAGSRALLLPMPMFFRYQQEDLQAFAAHVSRALRAPCLLYDLPDFTNGLAPETALALLRDEEFIVGIKDSSGREENVTTFAQARQDRDWTLLVGDDRLLSAGLLAGWDGGISGVAGCCPELLVAIVRSVRDQRPERDGQAAGAARRAHRAPECVSDAVGHPDCSGGTRAHDRTPAASAHPRATTTDSGIPSVVSRVENRANP